MDSLCKFVLKCGLASPRAGPISPQIRAGLENPSPNCGGPGWASPFKSGWPEIPAIPVTPYFFGVNYGLIVCNQQHYIFLAPTMA